MGSEAQGTPPWPGSGRGASVAERTRGDVWVAGALVLLRGCWALFFFPEASGLLSALFSEWPAQGQAEDEEQLWS